MKSLQIPFTINNPSDAFKLLTIWYKNPSYKGKKIFWLANKSRIELLVDDHYINFTWFSNLNPHSYIEIPSDLFSKVTYLLSDYINNFPIQ